MPPANAVTATADTTAKMSVVDPLLEVRGVSVHFSGLRALADVAFRVREGCVFSIIGPNGAGKTTLFNTISGDQKPTAGTVHFAGEKISGMPAYRICWLGISRTYQHVRPFLGMRVRDNLRVGLLYGRRRDPLPARGPRMQEELDALLDLLSLSGTKWASELTPLEQKKLEIGRALATAPRLLLLDELIAGLTPTEVLAMMTLITQVKERGITILMIEHVMKAVMRLSDEVLVLHHGEPIAQGSPEQISNDERVVAAYLGSSLSTSLASE